LSGRCGSGKTAEVGLLEGQIHALSVVCAVVGSGAYLVGQSFVGALPHNATGG